MICAGERLRLRVTPHCDRQRCRSSDSEAAHLPGKVALDERQLLTLVSRRGTGAGGVTRRLATMRRWRWTSTCCSPSRAEERDTESQSLSHGRAGGAGRASAALHPVQYVPLHLPGSAAAPRRQKGGAAPSAAGLICACVGGRMRISACLFRVPHAHISMSV